jgi:hypothetical protein
LETGSFCDGDNEEAQEYIPKIEGELSSKMGADVRRLTFIFVLLCRRSIYAQRIFFVNIGTTDGNGNWKYGDIHHDEVRHLDSRVKLGKVYHTKSSGTC